MSSLWWIIPVGAFMLWCLVHFFGGGGPPSVKDERTTSQYDWGGRDYSD